MIKSLLKLGLLVALTGCYVDDETVAHITKIRDAGISDASHSINDAGITDAGVIDAGADVAACQSYTGESFDLSWPLNIPLNYNGGPVMTGPVDIYLIWYGSWDKKGTVPIIEDLVKNVGSSNWYQAISKYYQIFTIPDSDAGDAGVQVQQYAADQINFVKSIYVGYSKGSSLSDSQFPEIVTDVILRNRLSPDPSAIYMVLTSADVMESGPFGAFCSDYCGWHNSTTINGVDVKYAFIGDVEQCPQSCTIDEEYQNLGYLHSPNVDWDADGMSTVILHEMVEAITDPDVFTATAWQDGLGYESADKCAWTFGNSLYTTDNCSIANTVIGDRNFMIQQNWILDVNGGHCGMSISNVP